MTRIGSSTPANDAQAPRETAPLARREAHFAALYGGTTRFAYAQAPGAQARGSALARQLAALNARRRNAARRTTQWRRPATAGGDAPEHANEGGGLRIGRDGGGGGGAGGGHGGQGQDDRGSGSGGAAAPTGFRARSGQPVIAQPERGALQNFVAAQPPGADLSRTLPPLWCDALLALRDEAAARPGALIDARVHERFIDLIAAQQKAGAPGDASAAAWRQRLIDASAAGQRGARAQRAQAADGGMTRAGLLNLLMPLMLLMYAKPSTAPMRDHAMNVRTLQRGGAAAAIGKPGAPPRG